MQAPSSTTTDSWPPEASGDKVLLLKAEALIQAKLYTAAIGVLALCPPDSKAALSPTVYAKLMIADWQDIERPIAQLLGNVREGEGFTHPSSFCRLPMMPPSCIRSLGPMRVAPSAMPRASAALRNARQEARIGYFSADFTTTATCTHGRDAGRARSRPLRDLRLSFGPMASATR